MWLKAEGKILVEEKVGRVSVDLGQDFSNYYNWLIIRKYRKKFQTGRFSSHISLALPDFHRKVDFEIAKKYDKKIVDFEYNIDINIGGKRKGFTNFWMKVRSEEIEKIRRHIKAFDSKDWQGLHITISSDKSKNLGEFWWDTIEIK